MEHLVATPGVSAWVGAGSAGITAGGCKFHHGRRGAVDIRDAKTGGGPKAGVGLHELIIILKVTAQGGGQIAIKIPLASDKDGRVNSRQHSGRRTGG